MTFVQVIDLKTGRLDELNQLMDSWLEATKGKRTATHEIIGKDRKNADHVVEIVEFPSYEEAMKNSSLPETDRIFREIVALCDEAPTFTDLDVVRDEQLNKATIERFFREVVNARNFDLADTLCTADYREHDPALSSPDASLAQAKRENAAILAAFEPAVTVEDIVAEGDRVCVRFSSTGRHVGDFQGMPATGKEFSGTGHATFRMAAGGKIAESWWNWDEAGLMRQLSG